MSSLDNGYKLILWKECTASFPNMKQRGFIKPQFTKQFVQIICGMDLGASKQ